MTAGRDQFVAFGIATNGTQNGGFHPESCQRHGDVHGNATGQARDATGHVRAALHLHSASPDYVPQDRADAEDVGRARHGDICTARTGEGKRFAGGEDAA